MEPLTDHEKEMLQPLADELVQEILHAEQQLYAKYFARLPRENRVQWFFTEMVNRRILEEHPSLT